jgi:hypothetical protein
MPRVLNYYTDEWRGNPNAIYCGRGSPYGNPFQIGKHGGREDVIRRFRNEVMPGLDLRPLRGKDLVCFCAPKRCHCDELLRAANLNIG